MPTHVVFGYTGEEHFAPTVISALVGNIDGVRGNINIQMFRGDDKAIQVRMRDNRNNIVSIFDALIWFTVKDKNQLDVNDDTNIIFQLKNEDAGGVDTEILIQDATNGFFEIYVLPENTEGVDTDQYEYDIQMELNDGKTYTTNRGKFHVVTDVTRS